MGPTKLFKMGPMKLFEMGPMNWYQWYPRLDIVCSHVLPPYSTCHYLHLKWYSFTGLRVATAPCGLADTKSHEEKRWRDDSTLRQTCTTGKIYFLRFRKMSKREKRKKDSGFILIIMIHTGWFFWLVRPKKWLSVRLHSKSHKKSSKCQNFLRVWHLVIFRADQ